MHSVLTGGVGSRRVGLVLIEHTLVVLSVLAVATVVLVGGWSARPQFLPLARDLAPSEAAEVVSNLESANIPHQLDFSGSSVLVPKERWNEARLASRDVLSDTQTEDGPFSGSILDDPTLNHHRVSRDKERALERSILRMSGVASADVW